MSPTLPPRLRMYRAGGAHESALPDRPIASRLCPTCMRIYVHAQVGVCHAFCARARVHEHPFAPDLAPGHVYAFLSDECMLF